MPSTYQAIGEMNPDGTFKQFGNTAPKGDTVNASDVVYEDTDVASELTQINSDLSQMIQSEYKVQTQIIPTASIESGETASKAYNVGDFLVKDSILYKVTKDIAENDALTVGTNIAIDTIASELTEIKSKSFNRVQLSLDAVAVGKDEDGDTVYEKTFKGSTISSGTVVDSNLTFSNLKWIRLVGGCFNNNDVEFTTLPDEGITSSKNSRHKFVVFSSSKGLVIEYLSYTVKGYHFTVQYVLK